MPSVLERFTSKVKVQDSGCHEWQSTLHRDGYGKFWFEGKQEKAHRVAYLLLKGEIPKGLNVLHKCDNRACVNTSHLYVGDNKQNAADRSERLRWSHEKLTVNEVAQIRQQYAAGKATQQELAMKFGCDQTHVSRIVRLAQRTAK